MLLSEVLRSDLIEVGLDATNRREAIGELVDLLVQRHEIAYTNRTEVVESLRAHDDSVVSGMEGGIAVPHAVTDRAEDIIAALGVSKAGIDFHATDGKPSHIVIVLIAPKRDFSGEVRTLAGIQHLFENELLKEKIRTAGTPDAVYDAIHDAEQHL